MGSHFFFGDTKPRFADGAHRVLKGVDDLGRCYIVGSSVGGGGGDLGVRVGIWVQANLPDYFSGKSDWTKD